MITENMEQTVQAFLPEPLCDMDDDAIRWAEIAFHGITIYLCTPEQYSDDCLYLHWLAETIQHYRRHRTH